jgi:hypothetical protein
MPPHPPPHQEPPEAAGASAWGAAAAFAGSSWGGAMLWWNDRVLSPDFLGGTARSSLVRAEPVEDGVAMSAPLLLLEAAEDEDSLGVFGRLVGRRPSGL